MVTLAPVTADNWEDVVDLEVEDSERDNLASNAYSLAQSKFEPEAVPLAIVAGGQPVGFMMYERDSGEDGRCSLYRFMIDREQRGHGYGRKALECLIARLRAEPGITSLSVCYVPGNETARRLYGGVGFVETGLDGEGEMIAVLDLARSRPVE